MSDRFRYPSIPRTSEAAQNAAAECIEVMLRRRGRATDSMVSVRDLIDLGLIKPEDVAKLEGRR